jgi:hypothetical protein
MPSKAAIAIVKRRRDFISANVKSQRPEPTADGIRIVPGAKRLAPVRCTGWLCDFREYHRKRKKSQALTGGCSWARS